MRYARSLASPGRKKTWPFSKFSCAIDRSLFRVGRRGSTTPFPRLAGSPWKCIPSHNHYSALSKTKRTSGIQNLYEESGFATENNAIWRAKARRQDEQREGQMLIDRLVRFL